MVMSDITRHGCHRRQTTAPPTPITAAAVPIGADREGRKATAHPAPVPSARSQYSPRRRGPGRALPPLLEVDDSGSMGTVMSDLPSRSGRLPCQRGPSFIRRPRPVPTMVTPRNGHSKSLIHSFSATLWKSTRFLGIKLHSLWMDLWAVLWTRFTRSNQDQPDLHGFLAQPVQRKNSGTPSQRVKLNHGKHVILGK